MNDDAVEAHKERHRGIPPTRLRAPTGLTYTSVHLCAKDDVQRRTYEAGVFSCGHCRVCGVPTTRVYVVAR